MEAGSRRTSESSRYDCSPAGNNEQRSTIQSQEFDKDYCTRYICACIEDTGGRHGEEYKMSTLFIE